MILVDRTIIKKINFGDITIEPFYRDMLGPSSYDFRLGNTFLVFHHQLEVIDPRNLGQTMETVFVDDGEYFILHPGQFALAGSMERFTISDHLVAQVNGKSSLGRLGLQIHATAGFFDPGWDGIATLELSNVAPVPIRLYPGMLIAQMVFMQGSEKAERPYGSGELNSKYQGADDVQSSRYNQTSFFEKAE